MLFNGRPTNTYKRPKLPESHILKNESSTSTPLKRRESMTLPHASLQDDWGTTMQSPPSREKIEQLKAKKAVLIRQKIAKEHLTAAPHLTNQSSMAKKVELNSAIVGIPSKIIPKRKREPEDREREHLEIMKVRTRQTLASDIPDHLPANAKGFRIGFANFTGSECYRSSLMQALCNSPKLINFILSNHDTRNCYKEWFCNESGNLVNDCALCHVRKLVSLYWGISDPHNENRNKAIGSCQRSLNKLAKRNGFRTDDFDRGNHRNGQGDPNDFLNWLLNEIPNTVPSP